MRRRWARSTGIAVAVCVLGPLLLPGPAGAAYDPLGSGTVTLTLAPGFQRLLARHGVKLAATGSATGHGRSFGLPVAGGSLDPKAGKGKIDTEGSIVFRRGRLAVPLRHLTVKTKRTPLLAKVGGGQLKLATAAKLSFARHGFGATFTTGGLRLSAKLATRLAKKLHLHDVFTAGQSLGSLKASTLPATLAVRPSGAVSFAPDPAFLAKLNGLFVSLNPIAPAERQPGPIFTVPFIPAGTIAPDAAAGVPRTGGSLEFLQLGSGQIFWHELWFDLAAHQVLAEVDLEPTPAFAGKLGQIPILGLGQGAVEADPAARTVSLTAAPLILNERTAIAFNEAFARPQGKGDVFQAGESAGTLSFTAGAE